MQVYLIVVLLAPVARYETIILKWVALHETSLY